MATTLKTAIKKALKSAFSNTTFDVTKNRQGILIVEWVGEPSKETVKAVTDSVEAMFGSWCGVRLWQTQNEIDAATVIDETQSVNEESKKIERRELINQLTHYSILLNNTEYDTEKWNAIFDKTQELRAAIEKLS